MNPKQQQNIYVDAMSRIKQSGKGKLVSGYRVVTLIHHLQAEIEHIDRKIERLNKYLGEDSEDFIPEYSQQLKVWSEDLAKVKSCVHQLFTDLERDATSLRFDSKDEDLDDVVDLEEEVEEQSEEEDPDTDDLDFIAPEGHISAEDSEYDEDTDTIESDEL